MQWRRGRAYSQDLRERVLALYDVGDAVGEIADALCVSVSYVSKALSRRRDTGETSARPQRCHVPPKRRGSESALFGLHKACENGRPLRVGYRWAGILCGRRRASPGQARWG